MNELQMQQARQLSSLLIQPKITRSDKKNIDRLVDILGDLGESFLAISVVDKYAILRTSSLTCKEKWNAIFEGKNVLYKADFNS